MGRDRTFERGPPDFEVLRCRQVIVDPHEVPGVYAHNARFRLPMRPALPYRRVLRLDHLDTGVVPDAVDRAEGRRFAPDGRQDAQAFAATSADGSHSLSHQLDDPLLHVRARGEGGVMPMLRSAGGIPQFSRSSIPPQ